MYRRTETDYDIQSRKIVERVIGTDGAVSSLVQYGYDALGRLECTAVRMNPTAYGALPASACSPGAEGGFGPDRITRNVYDPAGQLVQVRKAVGTPIEMAEETYSYTPDGLRKSVIDANGNRAELRYDGFDRQASWVFPRRPARGLTIPRRWPAHLRVPDP